MRSEESLPGPLGTGVGRSHGFTDTVNVGLVNGSRTGSLGLKCRARRHEPMHRRLLRHVGSDGYGEPADSRGFTWNRGSTFFPSPWGRGGALRGIAASSWPDRSAAGDCRFSVGLTTAGR